MTTGVDIGVSVTVGGIGAWAVVGAGAGVGVSVTVGGAGAGVGVSVTVGGAGAGVGVGVTIGGGVVDGVAGVGTMGFCTGAAFVLTGVTFAGFIAAAAVCAGVFTFGSALVIGGRFFCVLFCTGLPSGPTSQSIHFLASCIPCVSASICPDALSRESMIALRLFKSV